MNLRLALYDWIARYGIDAAGARALLTVAGLRREPPALARWFWPGVAAIGAVLGGLGVLLWVAANWPGFGRTARFALLQGLLVLLCLGAALQPRARTPLGLLALLGIGALLAFFGQTYQTGADPWQLFALWMLLALTLCLGLRSDWLWAPWALVAMVAISLWTHAHAGWRWSAGPDTLAVHAVGWIAAVAVVAALAPAAARFTGAGPVAWRAAGLLAVVLVAASALGALFQAKVAPHYPLALLLFAALAAAMAWRAFDLLLLSAVALALDTLLVAGLARWLFEGAGARGEPLAQLAILGLAAALLLAASVTAVLRIARRHG